MNKKAAVEIPVYLKKTQNKDQNFVLIKET